MVKVVEKTLEEMACESQFNRLKDIARDIFKDAVELFDVGNGFGLRFPNSDSMCIYVSTL